MMPFDAVFDASQVAPSQGGAAHPVGNKFPFRITNTAVTSTQKGDGGMFEVEFTSDVGSIMFRYNLWNQSPAAREIAQKQLSALCHATGVMMLDFKNDGAALRNARGLMDVGFQKGHEPSPEKPAGGYVEIKRIYDVNGNEPGKPPVNNAAPQGGGFGQQAPQQGQAPQQQGNPPQPQNGFGAPQGQAQQPQQQQPNPGWGTPQAQQQQPQPQQQQPNSGAGGWQQNNTGAAPQNPPWGGGAR